MFKRVLLIGLLIFFAQRILGQQSFGVASKSITSTNTETGKFYFGNHNEPPRAIEFKAGTVTSSSFLATINGYFGIPAEYTFTETETNTDNLGMRHRFLQQNYKGIPLEGMGYRVHEKGGFVTSANGKAVRDMKVELQTAISERQAFSLALQLLNSKDTTTRLGKKLIVSKSFTFSPESFSVAFQFDIDVSLIERWRVSIDARTGQLINKVSLVTDCGNEKEPSPLPYGTATGLTNYYGNKTVRVEKFENGYSRLLGETEHGGIIGTYDFANRNILLLFFEPNVPVYDFYSSTNIYSSIYQKPAVSVQWAAEQAYEYYFKRHNRNSFDNQGSAIKSYVHVGQDYSNAFWNGRLMAFGDGINNNPLVELDVVSHELTHGVTQYEAQLQYYGEYGALNESFSDIFGKAVEFDTFGDTATWQLASHYRSGGLRDLSNPNLKNQPDTYFGDMWYTGYEDSGGVHYNSGVQNFWFYLLCKGGSGVNDHQESYSVQAIGIDAATKIAYRNLTEYLSYFSDYLDSRIGSQLAAADLFGKNSATYQEVANAWDAVGVIDEPIITRLELFDITATTVKIKGNFLPRGDTATYHFEYGATPAFGTSSSVYKYTDKVEGIVRGLQSNTKYYLRLVATNENGNSYSATEFTTLALTPLAKIKQTVDVTETTAILYGQINPNSLPTSFYFEYGLTPAFGYVTPSYTLPDTTEFLTVSVPITNLQSHQTYYYRLIATNNFASATTESASFFTAVKPTITSYAPRSAPIGTVVTISGQNFNSISEKNIVSFGATRGVVLSSTSTEIKVKVPAGASLGLISLLDNESGLAAESVQEFVPTFSSGFKKGDLQLRVGISDLYVWQTLVEDMDGDSKPDIVTRHYQGFSIFQNVNQGGDITEQSFVRSTFPTENSLGGLYLVDFDGNGLKDIVGQYQSYLRIYPNLSVPGFIFFGAPVDLSIGNFGDLIFKDFDLDGHVDIAGIFYNAGESIMSIVRNQNPKGILIAKNFERKYAKILPYYSVFFDASDLNNDGSSDILVSGFNANDFSYDKSFLSVFNNNSHPGIFDFNENIVLDPIGNRFTQSVVQDINQDGWKDITLHLPYGGNLAVSENKGTSPNITLAIPTATLSGYDRSIIRLGDITGDGKVDMLVSNSKRKFTLLKNKLEANEHFSNLSLEKFEEYGMGLIGPNGDLETQMTINDLNGDGRPEVINTNSYHYWPHDGYQMEIWQNSPAQCLDPSKISINVTNTATLVLPPNTTLDQFEIDFRYVNSTYWYQATSLELYLNAGYSYQLRARAKCYLGFTDYYYIDFTTDCVNTNYFTVSSIDVDKVTFNTYNYLDVQYSPAGKNNWLTLSQNSNQITNLLPGTTYDLRVRGFCNPPAQYSYRQFTTLCPKLNTLTVTSIVYNKAVVAWTSSYGGNAILEYSADNLNWIPIPDSKEMFPLIPSKQYFVRGRKACTNLNSDFTYASFTTPCPKVSSITADAITPFSLRINWRDDTNTGNYTLTYSLTGSTLITTMQTRSTSLTLNGLKPGTKYSVRVAPECISAKDFTSATFSTVCFTPFNLSASNVTHTAAELSWSDTFGGVPYFIDYSIAGSKTWQTAETALTTLLLTGLRPATQYEARVHINCLSETAPYTSLFFETTVYSETTFAPNPTYKSITIYPSKNLIGNRYGIYDNAGRQIASGELLDYTIDLSILSPGIYTLKIDGEKTLKIVKN